MTKTTSTATAILLLLLLLLLADLECFECSFGLCTSTSTRITTGT